MEPTNFGREYFRQLLLIFIEKTGKFSLECFERVADEPAVAPEKVLRVHRLRGILDKVKLIGLKRYYQLPGSLRRYHVREDWIQDAMRLLLENAPQYDPQHGLSFNQYILIRVKQRLLDIQRAIVRKYPPPDEDAQRSLKSLRWEIGREPTDEDVANFLGCSVERASEFLCAAGSGGGETGTLSPELQIVQQEQRLVLWECIEQLQLKYKLLFVLHEFEEVSFAELFQRFSNFLDSASQSTFQRRYRKIWTAVTTCVKNRYRKTL